MLNLVEFWVHQPLTQRQSQWSKTLPKILNSFAIPYLVSFGANVINLNKLLDSLSVCFADQ